ncbi:MAG: bacteriocin-protection protein [Eudoraea sp.]|nr:YdeI/OmpD-associated family protein [Muriicola sp.]NNE02882.1 bacteriocin-protection protein [Eudoraea sp.]
MTPIFFKSPQEFRNWLAINHTKEPEVIVGYYKVKTGKPSMTWSESVDQAICYGWIDGIRRSLGPESYSIRFTPRRKNSNWSAVNIKKVKDLTAAGLMKEAGQKAYELWTDKKSNGYSYEKMPAVLNPEYKGIFKQHASAWDFFIDQAPSYRKVIIHWIMSAKKEETRLSRLQKVIHTSEQQKRVQ